MFFSSSSRNLSILKIIIKIDFGKKLKNLAIFLFLLI